MRSIVPGKSIGTLLQIMMAPRRISSVRWGSVLACRRERISNFVRAFPVARTRIHPYHQPPKPRAGPPDTSGNYKSGPSHE